MRAKKMAQIQQTIHELMLENKINNSITSELRAGELETQRYYIYIEIVNTNPVLSYVFNSDVEIIVGRSLSETTITIQDPYVSKRHCRIFFYQGYIYIQNISDMNQITVKQGWKKQVLNPTEMMAVYQKDIIHIGKEKFKMILFHGSSVIEN